MNIEIYDCIVIGAGPAGLSAYIYLKDACLNCLIISENKGGQLMTTDSIHNYPGYVNDSSYGLVDNMYQQCEKRGLNKVSDTVVNIEELDNNLLAVYTKRNKVIKTKSLIIASGSRTKEIMFRTAGNSSDLISKSVFTCVHCDADSFVNRTTAVLGGGNSGLEAALYLSNLCSKVYLIHRRDQMKAFQSIVNKAKDKENIKFILSSTITDLIVDENGYLQKIEVTNLVNNSVELIQCDGLFLSIGSDANSSFIKNIVNIDEFGNIITNNTATNKKNIFACGDVTDREFKQAIVSAGQGAVAAMKVIKYLFYL